MHKRDREEPKMRAQNHKPSTDQWSYLRLDEVGGTDRPVLKAGPFGSAVTKDIYVAGGFKVYGQQEVVSKDVNAAQYYVTAKIYTQLKSCAVEPGDILITMMGTVGRVFEVPMGAPQGIINPRLMRISVDRHRAIPEFVSRVLESPPMRRLLERRAHGGTMPGLNAETLGSITIPLPPIAEQRGIAEILRTWDEAIEKLEALRAVKAKLAAAIADDLIFGVRRIADHREPWLLLRLAEVTRELTRRNRDEVIGRELVMGVTNSRGIVPMREQTIAADISRYLVLPPRAFAYNPMRINVGSIAISRFEHDALVSPDYVLFECVPGKLDPDFLDHLRQSHFWSHYINAGGTGSVRMRTYYDDLAALRLKLPPFDEQLAISEVLNAAQQELRLIGDQIETIKRQKRGLMQKLLTGEWSVKVKRIGQ
jgi:type I restriction enzyme, S subunit